MFGSHAFDRVKRLFSHFEDLNMDKVHQDALNLWKFQATDGSGF